MFSLFCKRWSIQSSRGSWKRKPVLRLYGPIGVHGKEYRELEKKGELETSKGLSEEECEV